MNIVISAVTYYPDKNGVQYVTQYQAEELVRRGHNVTIVTKLVEGLPKIDNHNGVKIIRVDIKNKCTLHFGDKNGYRNTIIQLCKDADILIAVCLQSVSADWLLGVLDKIECIKIIYMHGMHDFKWRKIDFESFKAFLIKLIRNFRWSIFYRYNFKNIRKFDGSIHLHEQDNSYKYFKKYNLVSSYIVENCASEEFFLNNNYKKDNKYILCVANYDRRKNQEGIMKAFYRANTKEYSLVFIGSSKNKYYEHLKILKNELDKHYGEKDIKLLTNIERKHIPDYVKNASFYIMGSKWEAFPISIIESMAAGIPFISTDVGIVKLLPGGVIVENEIDMINEIESFINGEKDLESIGNQGKIYAEKNLSQSVAVDKLENIFLNLIRNYREDIK